MGRPLLEPKRNRTFSEASVRVNYNNRKLPLQGPLRVVRLCVLSVIIPGILVGVPLYMRYYIYGEQVYPVSMSDMRLLDHRVSTTWCQSQTVWSNATFNAYLMENQPQMEKDHDHVSMTRELNNLEDDMKEYWGFYLLKGSTIVVSTCARYPGASLILIRGHKHLRDCAYIGDDSSEELDELYPNDNNLTEVSQNPANRPEKMKKMSDGVVIRGHINGTQQKLSDSGSDSISKIDVPKRILSTGLKVGNRIHLAFAEHGNRLAKYNIDLEKLKSNFSSSNKNDNIKSNKKSRLQPEYTASETPTVLSSRELYEELLQKLQKLGSKGKRILDKLNEKISNDTTVFNTTESGLDKSTESTENKMNPRHRLRHNRKFMKLNRTSSKTEDEQRGLRREKREILLNTLHDVLNQDEDNDTAMEEEIHNPDELAEIRGSVNETTPNDKSNSEFWSSFSSSEERLLNCEGLLVNLPLSSHAKCSASLPDHHNGEAVFPNIITYRVTSNGYYFFVFNSENEVKPNFLRIHFKLEKTKYNVTSPVASCKNQTAACNLPLTFWSSQKVVLQLPVRPNDALWNQEFLAISTCEPRTSIYVACVIAVPLFIILFAFQ